MGLPSGAAARAPTPELLDLWGSVSDVLATVRVAPEPECLFVSDSVERVLGYRPDELYDDPLLAVQVLPVTALRGATPDGDAQGVVELRLRHRGGQPVWSEITYRWATDGEQRVVDLVLRAMRQQILGRGGVSMDPFLDVLTGLPNRTLLMDRLDRALLRQARHGRMLAVMFVDVDRFKVVNDSLGHTAGDAVLVEVADRMVHALRPSDTVSRFGGDEFVVLCEDVDDPEHALELARRLTAAVQVAPVAKNGRDVPVRVSVGVTATGDPDRQPETLISEADAAMYVAKERGRNRVEMFDSSMRHRALHQLEMESDLRSALAAGELAVHYQPIVDVATERIVAVEALLRWHRPGHGHVAPGELVALAEETGLIVPIGAWVIDEVCREVAARPAALDEVRASAGNGSRRQPLREPLPTAVNVSARQLADGALPLTIHEALRRHDVAPDALTLEITESVLMSDTRASPRTVERLRELGVAISVDDFGTGYSSLLYLRRFPGHSIKIDRLFVAGVCSNDEDAAIVRSVVELAHALGRRAVAEGVETRAQLDVLRQLGCDQAQGFLWSPAVPGRELVDLLARERRLGTAWDLPRPRSGAAGTERSPTRRPTAHRRTVVLVDDSLPERALMRAVLEEAGDFDVVGEADNGERAIEVVASSRPEVVLLDLSMPRMGGLDALGRLVALVPDGKVAVVSGYVSAGIAREARAAGAVACIEKGSGPAHIIDELRIVLGDDR